MCTATLDNYRKKRIALLKDNTDGVIGNEMQYDAGNIRQNLVWTNSTAKNLNLTKKSPRLEMGQHAKTAGIV